MEPSNVPPKGEKCCKECWHINNAHPTSQNYCKDRRCPCHVPPSKGEKCSECQFEVDRYGENHSLACSRHKDSIPPQQVEKSESEMAIRYCSTHDKYFSCPECKPPQTESGCADSEVMKIIWDYTKDSTSTIKSDRDDSMNRAISKFTKLLALSEQKGVERVLEVAKEIQHELSDGWSDPRRMRGHFALSDLQSRFNHNK